MRNLFIYIGILCFISCKKDQASEQMDIGYHYWPLHVGNEWIYEVDSSFVVATDTHRVIYQERIYIDTAFLDLTGDSMFRVSVYKNQSLVKVYALIKNDRRIEQVQAKRTVKMIFPVQENDQWNINAFSEQEPLEVSYRDVDDSFSKGDFSFEKTCSVVYEDFETLLDEYAWLEVYAQHIGLVFYDETRFDNVEKQGVFIQKKLISYHLF